MQRTLRSIKLSAPTSGVSLKTQVKMLSAKRMRFLFLVLPLLVTAKSSTKQKKDTSSAKSTASPNAVIAIEIVDPNENATSSRNSKRTIEDALGYGGYSSYRPPKYEVYKYSQHDIPPFQRGGGGYSGYSGPSQVYDIQKSISYDLGTHTSRPQFPNLNSYYQPGTTLYTSLNNQGKVSHLSSHLPSQAVGGHVPVIILRIYPNQLSGGASGGLYAKLPQSHPYASSINSINLQDLLQKYVQNALVNTPKQQPQVYQVPQAYQPTYPQTGLTHYATQSYAPPKQYYTQTHQQYSHPNYHFYQRYEQPTVYNRVKQPYQSAPTYENYPDDAHTRVLFKQGAEIGKPTPVPSVSASPAYGKFEEEQPNAHAQYNYEDNSDNSGYYYEKPSQVTQNYPEVVDNYKQQSPQQHFQFDINEFLPAQYTREEDHQGQEAHVPPEASEGQDEPFNYHAHPDGGRAKKNARVRGNVKSGKKASRDKRERLEK